jgi:hypothetical protein
MPQNHSHCPDAPYWKHGRGLWQSDIDRWLAAGVSIQALAWPLPVVRAGVIFSGARFVFEADTERDDGHDAYVVPVTAAGRIIDLCAFAIDGPGVATWAGAAKALGEDEVYAPNFDAVPLPVWRSLDGWLAAGRRGLVLLQTDPGTWIDHVPGLIAEDGDHGEALRRLFPTVRIFVWTRKVAA